MNPPPNPETSIEHFAALSARLHDPFADEPRVLREVGLDSAAWQRLAQTWTKRLQEDTPEARALATRFGDAYEGALGRGSEGSTLPRQEGALGGASDRFLNPEATLWRAEAAEVPSSIEGEATEPGPSPLPPREAPTPLVPSYLVGAPASDTTSLRGRPRAALEQTADLSDVLSKLVIPFRAASPSVAQGAEPPEAKAGDTSRRRLGTNTAELPQEIVLAARKTALPFPAAPAGPPEGALPPGKRLVFFDPQTGQRLAEPRWEDVAVATPTGRK